MCVASRLNLSSRRFFVAASQHDDMMPMPGGGQLRSPKDYETTGGRRARAALDAQAVQGRIVTNPAE